MLFCTRWCPNSCPEWYLCPLCVLSRPAISERSALREEESATPLRELPRHLVTVWDLLLSPGWRVGPGSRTYSMPCDVSLKGRLPCTALRACCESAPVERR